MGEKVLSCLSEHEAKHKTIMHKDIMTARNFLILFPLKMSRLYYALVLSFVNTPAEKSKTGTIAMTAPVSFFTGLLTGNP
jgi:hypothetical protein